MSERDVSEGELTPRCVICGDELDLTQHLERLNQRQGLIDFLADVLPDSNPVMFDTTCQACKSDPDRAEAHLSAMAPGEASQRMVEEMERRTGYETPGARELKTQSYIDKVGAERYAIECLIVYMTDVERSRILSEIPRPARECVERVIDEAEPS